MSIRGRIVDASYFALPVVFAILVVLSCPMLAHAQQLKPKEDPKQKATLKKALDDAKKAAKKAADDKKRKDAAAAAKKAKAAEEKKKRAKALAEKKVEIEELKAKEARVIREAYILLAGANHDYLGHRAKAMDHLQTAVRVLEERLARNGSARTKLESEYEDAVAETAKRAQLLVLPVHENQMQSNIQLKNAAILLLELRPTTIKLDQRRVLHHIDRAVAELQIGLFLSWYFRTGYLG